MNGRIRPVILIVDDEENLRNAIAYDFERKGHEVICASSGVEAMRLIESGKRVDVVLTDVRMPDGSGLDLLKRIRSSCESGQPAVIFLTGFADFSVEEAYEYGACAVFPKPFDRKALHAAVEGALLPQDHRWKRRQERFVVSLAIQAEYASAGGSVSSRIQNIGRGGMFILLRDRFPQVGETISFKLQYSFQGVSALIEGVGVVRWVRENAIGAYPPGCGVEFVELTDPSRKSVAEVVNLLKVHAYIPIQ